MRGATICLVLTGALFVGCGPDRKCVNGDADVDSRDGLSVGGFAIAKNGLGYLTGQVSFVTCDGRHSGGARAFAVDSLARTAQTIVLEEIDPGKVIVRSDGNAGILMAYRDAFGFGGSIPLGVFSLNGLTPSLVPLGNEVLDIQPTDSGVIASAGSGGSWMVEQGTGDAQHVLTQASRCGAEGAGRLLLCSDGGVVVLDSSGSIVTTLFFTPPPVFVGGVADLGFVIAGTSLALIRDDAVESTIALGNSPDYGWISEDSPYAVVRSQQSFQLIDLAVPSVTWSFDTPYFPVTDVAFSGTKAIVLTGAETSLFDFGTGSSEWLRESSTGRVGLDLIERLSDSTFVLATSQNHYTRFEPGDSAARVFTLYDLDTGFGESWSLTVEE